MDKKKRSFYSNIRHNYKQLGSSSYTTNNNSLSRQSRLPKKPVFIVIAIVIILVLLSKNRHHNMKLVKLKDQPNYIKHQGNCSATLCNPSNKCSTWLPNKKYGWSDFSKAGIFRDLSTLQVSTGCELRVKVDGRVKGGEWLDIQSGFTECVEAGYGTHCRNFVEMDLKANVLVLANHLKSLMKERSGESQELRLVQQAKEDTGDNIDVTLISQFSVNRLGVFAKTVETWKGPISAAIYLTNPTDIDELIAYFKVKKNLELYSRMTITLVKPNYLSSDRLAYPINHLRNIAITESGTEYILVIDADFTVSQNSYDHIRQRLIPYILHQSSKILHTAWVIPCFAIREQYENEPIPNSYTELRQLVGRNIAYITDPGAGHGPTLATEVAMVRPLLMGNPLAYEVCYESQWEPYYVLHRSAPLYDVRFKNQGGDKQSHALQLNAEKYRFMILRELFMVHKDHSKMAWPGGGFEQSQKTVKTWNYFIEYMRELESLYGANPRWPRGCSATAIGWQDQRRDVVGLAAGAA